MDAKRAAPDENFSLPGWIYRDADFLQAEREQVFAGAWQVICHLNDIPNPGDYHTLDFLGEPIVAVRGRDSGVRAFFNVCRHRAARLVDGGSGHCPGRIVCPYHAWPYDLDGTLAAVPHRDGRAWPSGRSLSPPCAAIRQRAPPGLRSRAAGRRRPGGGIAAG